MPRDFDFTDFLTLSATVKTLPSTVVTDDMMGETQSYTTNNTIGTFSCALQPISDIKQEMFGRMGVQADLVCYTNLILDINNGDIIVINSVSYKVAYKQVQGGTDEVLAIYVQQLQ